MEILPFFLLLMKILFKVESMMCWAEGKIFFSAPVISWIFYGKQARFLWWWGPGKAMTVCGWVIFVWVNGGLILETPWFLGHSADIGKSCSRASAVSGYGSRPEYWAENCLWEACWLWRSSNGTTISWAKPVEITGMLQVLRCGESATVLWGLVDTSTFIKENC